MPASTADVLAEVTDEQLALPTPCEKLRLDELIAHIGMLALGVHRGRGQGVRPADRHPAR